MNGTVVGLARYPVKSMGGEACSELEIEPRAAVGDRRWAVHYDDGKLGSGKSSRRFRKTDGLLHWSARADDVDAPVVTSPEGLQLRAGDPDLDAALSRLAGAPVHLAPETDTPHLDAGPVSLVTMASLEALGRLLGDGAPADVRRFRKNVLIESDQPWIEESWVGSQVAVGEVRLLVTRRIERCVMVGMSQPGLPDDPRVLRTLTGQRDLCFGVYADVVTPGVIRLGDAAEVLRG